MRKLGGVAWTEFVQQGISCAAILMKKMNEDGRLPVGHIAVCGY